MRITAISQQKKDKNRFNIFVDRKFSFATDADTLIQHKLHANQEISQEELQQFIQASDFGKWLNKSLLLLSRRPRSTKEVVDYLNRHQVDEEIIQQVIKRLQSRKFLDDQAFAQWFVEQRLIFRPKGAYALTQELLQKGVAKQVIDQVITTSVSPDEEMKQALRLIQKKLSRWKSFDKLKIKQKIAQFLSARGYSWEVINEVYSKTTG